MERVAANESHPISMVGGVGMGRKGQDETDRTMT